MRNFGASERMTKMMERFGLEEGQELAHPWLNKSVETAQKRVEARNYQIRKHILEYDNVMNQQRDVVYGYRNDVLESEDPHKLIDELIEEALPNKTEEFFGVIDDTGTASTDLDGLLQWVNSTFPLGLSKEDAGLEGKSKEEVDDILIAKVREAYNMKLEHEDPDARKSLERHIMMNSVDRLWQEHLYAMDSLRDSVRLRSYGQKDPLVEYKNEAYAIFVELMDTIKGEILGNLFRSTTSVEGFRQFLANLRTSSAGDEGATPNVSLPTSTTTSSSGMPQGVTTSRPGLDDDEEDDKPKIKIPVKREVPKVGRNDDCPCGSGKKYKQCCGK